MAGQDFKTLERVNSACKPANPGGAGHVRPADPCPDIVSEPFRVPDRLDPFA